MVWVYAEQDGLGRQDIVRTNIPIGGKLALVSFTVTLEDCSQFLSVQENCNNITRAVLENASDSTGVSAEHARPASMTSTTILTTTLANFRN